MAAAVIALSLPLASQGSGAAVGDLTVSSSAADPGGLERAAPERCPSAMRAVKFYARRIGEHRARMGVAVPPREALQAAPTLLSDLPGRCPRYLAHVLQRKARAWRQRADRWVDFHWNWRSWMPAFWQAIARCESGSWPPDWRHTAHNHEGTFHGAFAFYFPSSWDGYKGRANPKAGPYPEDAYQATPRQQYEVALVIAREVGAYEAWGCA